MNRRGWASLVVLVALLCFSLHRWRCCVLDLRRCTAALRYQARRDGLARAERTPARWVSMSRYRGEDD